MFICRAVRLTIWSARFRQADIMSTATQSNARPVRLWLIAVAALIFATLIVGGATRLTESGLSITEWKPVTGVLPPTSEEGWSAEFEKYREIPQYRELNRGMTLNEFKTIYWWEWSHRLLARLVGAAFLLPFLYFLWRGAIPPGLKARLWTIFAGGAVLGAVGWWMVSSGLGGSDRVSVSQYRLAFHLTLACLIYAAIVWTAQSMVPRRPAEVSPRMRATALLVAGLVLVQIYLGAIVAGVDAGRSFNTWPLIDGHIVPGAARLWFEAPWWRNFFENILTVQFNHRMMAYAIWLIAVLHALDAWRHRGPLAGALTLAVLVTLQAALGIITLLYVAPLGLSLAHQGFAIVVLTAAVLHAEALRPQARLRDSPASLPVHQGARR
jgi:cytochrome c oxidase assembly protein subunit 15